MLYRCLLLLVIAATCALAAGRAEGQAGCAHARSVDETTYEAVFRINEDGAMFVKNANYPRSWLRSSDGAHDHFKPLVLEPGRVWIKPQLSVKTENYVTLGSISIYREDEEGDGFHFRDPHRQTLVHRRCGYTTSIWYEGVYPVIERPLRPGVLVAIIDNTPRDYSLSGDIKTHDGMHQFSEHLQACRSVGSEVRNPCYLRLGYELLSRQEWINLSDFIYLAVQRPQTMKTLETVRDSVRDLLSVLSARHVDGDSLRVARRERCLATHGDLDFSGSVNFTDFLLFTSRYNSTPPCRGY